jgi:undecaprenyl diphosphate synthase
MPLPNHLAIIPDGNRRWAKAHLLLSHQGHVEGIKRFWEISETAAELGLKHLTFWAGSYDNLAKRSAKEVEVLFKLMSEELAKPELLESFQRHQTQLKVIGEWEGFSNDHRLQAVVSDMESKTSSYSNNHLSILFGYDGQREMLAAQTALRQSKEDVSTENLRKHLWTRQLPDVDLVIRTGGEPHWSAGFMMWHTANSQFYFTEELWPDFKTQQLKTALDEFERRERRLGK